MCACVSVYNTIFFHFYKFSTVCKCKFLQRSLTSAFRRDVDEICALLRYHAAYRGANKSLARPGRKQATATKLWLSQATQKKNQKFVRPTRSLGGNNNLGVGRKMSTFQLFLSRVGLRTYQHSCIVVIPYRNFGPICPIFKGKEYYLPLNMGPIICPEMSVRTYPPYAV